MLKIDPTASSFGDFTAIRALLQRWSSRIAGVAGDISTALFVMDKGASLKERPVHDVGGAGHTIAVVARAQ